MDQHAVAAADYHIPLAHARDDWRVVLRLTADVADALRERRPVVALESSVLAQGLPIPANREAAERMMGAVRAAGALPAIAAIIDGEATLGLTNDELERFLLREGIRKVSSRDLAPAVAQGACGATTVAATLALMVRSDVRVFATGGIGGVHRAPPYDESADLVELARSPCVVVCAGAKSVLDLPATLERLETLGVPVIGFRTSDFPAFLSSSSGLAVSAVAESAEEIAAIERAHRRLGRREALLVVQPPPVEWALDRAEVDAAVSDALREAESAHVRGNQLTPFLLRAVERATGGRSRVTNLALLEANAHLAGAVAVALRRLEG
ncbi:MAG: pseudouridine-5'-phosphate glycosidase [Gemmatimonadaceae bacterium]|nr:pseudouridine-5'-phosphate glycosidase [Gemmatimonadaceae bacterium]